MYWESAVVIHDAMDCQLVAVASEDVKQIKLLRNQKINKDDNYLVGTIMAIQLERLTKNARNKQHSDRFKQNLLY